MSLTAMSLLESARRKFFMTRRASCQEGWIQTFLGLRRQMSLIAMSLLESARRKFFMNATCILSRK